MERVAHSVAMRIKYSYKKLTRDLGEHWMDFVDEYMMITRDSYLSPSQKFQYLQNEISKDPQCFYLDRVQNYATTFQQALYMLNHEYNYPVRQTRA